MRDLGGWRSPRFWWRQPGLLLSSLLVAMAALWAVFPTVFAKSDPTFADPSQGMQSPNGSHWFGTDQLGRDIYSRVVHGARDSLAAAALAVLLALVVGGLLGLLAGFRSGKLDEVIMRIVDVLLAIPSLLLALTVVSALGFGTVNVAIAVGVVSVASFTRLMRSEVIRVRNLEFVEAARASGLRTPPIVLRHILPNSWGPVWVLATLDFGASLLAVSSLAFLGFGTPPPAPEWGSMVSAGRSFLGIGWWMSAMPGVTIAVVVLAVNRIGRALDAGTDH